MRAFLLDLISYIWSVDINSYNVLVKRKKDAQAELEDINCESFDLKVRKARAEKIIDQVDYELHKDRFCSNQVGTEAKCENLPQQEHLTERDIHGQ